MLVVGGGLGGVAAALAAAERGARVVLSEETDWLGGQLTSQAVPPDEHPWIEDFGCTARYRALREAIRAHYRAHRPLTAAARARADLNPGSATVSRLAIEPRAGAGGDRGDARAAPRPDRGRCSSTRRSRPTPTATASRRSRCAARTGDRVVEADWFVDATETGDLLPLAGVEHVTGAESRERTGEPHAAAVADPLNMQPVSACFAVDHLAGEDHTIPRPPGYDRLRSRFSLTGSRPAHERARRPHARPQPARRPGRGRPRPLRPVRSTRTCGCSAGSPPAGTSRPATCAATSRS